MKSREEKNSQAGEKIPYSRFDTRSMTPEKALAAWQENIDVIFDASVHDVGEKFRVIMDAFMLDEVMLVNVPHVAAQHYKRSSRRIGRDGVDHYLLQFYLKGSVAARNDKSRMDGTQPGDLWITDLAQPLSSTATQAEAINLIIPRRFLSPLLDAPDTHSMRILSGEQPLVGLLRNHLQALAAAAPSMTSDDARRVIVPTLELAAAALNGGAHRQDTVSGVEHALLEAICRHVNAALPKADITLERVAGQFGISTRKLSYLFEPFGGFASWVRQRRLALVRATLTDPGQMHRTIEEIAEAHGFSHKANLGRAFRELYGLTPGQVRTFLKERLAGEGIREADFRASSEWQHWIKGM